ncbi:LysR family transcriptional regulator [Agrococcus sp. ARC_14]|uniref:LysR family transcriptional regulator n=1 Tax=Agrococcus sp. ARC_14 TaxID=2919927 RepID=UPI001F06E7F8|nr:LysR family transcriptional regulator [Agrococcus sp. ARC_14]MCH1881921.1 LysR family transcriptional regulator [Agrococcus sp. ARC_14]
MLDVRDLECLAVLAEELHFHRAALRLGIAQPALSKRVQKIEAELGIELFVRGSGGVALTTAGQELLGHARTMLGGWRAMQRAAEQLRAGARGVVRIGAVGSAFYEALPRLLAPVRAALPDVALQVDELETPELVDALRVGEVQLGFVRPPIASGFRVEPVWSEQFVAAVPDTSPLAQHETVAVADLSEHPVVLFPRSAGTGYWDRVAALFQEAGIEFEPIESAAHVTTILGQVALGIGVSIVPASAERVAIPGVSYVRLEHPISLPLAVASNPGMVPLAARRVLEHLPGVPIIR